MTELAEKPADTGSDYDTVIHVVCCDTRFCDGEFEMETLPPGKYPDDCLVCADLEHIVPCRVCGT